MPDTAALSRWEPLSWLPGVIHRALWWFFSQDHRRVGVGQGSGGPQPLLPEQITQHCVQALQRRQHSSSGQPDAAFGHPQREDFFPYVHLEASCVLVCAQCRLPYHWAPLPRAQPLDCHPLDKHWQRDPLGLLLPRLDSPTELSPGSSQALQAPLLSRPVSSSGEPPAADGIAGVASLRPCSAERPPQAICRLAAGRPRAQGSSAPQLWALLQQPSPSPG